MTIAKFLGAINKGLRDPEFRSLIVLAGLLLLSGTLFYRAVEGWTWLDSLYFSVVSLVTVGDPQHSPQTDIGKGFTMIYLLIGVGVFLGFVGKVAQHAGTQDPISRFYRYFREPEQPREPPKTIRTKRGAR